MLTETIKLCECGCGQPTSLIREVPNRFIVGHSCKKESTRKLLSSQRLGEKNPNWKGTNITTKSGRYRAKSNFKLRLCDRCGIVDGTDRHHKDGNTLNNDVLNISILCRRCHMIEDGRLKIMVLRNIKKSLESNVKYSSCKLYCKRGHKLQPYPYLTNGKKKERRWCPICKKESRKNSQKAYMERQRAKVSYL